MPEEPSTETRRDVLKKGVVVAPVILTLPAIASFARAGFWRRRGRQRGRRREGPRKVA